MDITEPNAVIPSAEAIVEDPHADEATVLDALVALADADPSKLPNPDDVPALNLSEPASAISVATTLRASANTLDLALQIACSTFVDGKAPDVDSDKALELLIVLLGGHQYELAIRAGERIVDDSAFFRIAKTFNIAVARWGMNQSPDDDCFGQVVDLAQSVPDYHGMANFSQCLALCHAVLGNVEAMTDMLTIAREAVTIREDSCWTFTRVARAEFVEHCDAIQRFGEGRGDPPAVVRRADETGLLPL